MNYAVVQISGRQYKVVPGKEILVDYLGEETKNLTAEVLLMSDGDKLDFGTPFLDKKLEFEVVGHTKDKIRVAKYHAKANTRKVTGAKVFKTKVKLKEGK